MWLSCAMPQQAAVPLSPTQCCYGPNYHFLKSHEGYTSSLKAGFIAPMLGWLREPNMGQLQMTPEQPATCYQLQPCSGCVWESTAWLHEAMNETTPATRLETNRPCLI